MSDIITPIIHLNGDRKETLVTNLENVYKAVKNAALVLMQAVPNSRNYYPEQGRYEKAMQQHFARLHALQNVVDSVCAEVNQLEEETSPWKRKGTLS